MSKGKSLVERRKKENFTADRVDGYVCAPGKKQDIYWDKKTPGLGLRVTSGGSRSFIFEVRLNGKTYRHTIGDRRTYGIAEAQAEATSLKALTDKGVNPRQLMADQINAAEAEQQAKEAEETERARQETLERAKHELLARVAWNAYLDEPHQKRKDGKKKTGWGAQHRADHAIAASEGGEPHKRGKGITKPGPLASLLNKPLHEITALVVKQWMEAESAIRPTFTLNAFRKFRTFIRWCARHPEYCDIVHADCCLHEDVQGIVPASNTKEGDCLQREQLRPWFDAVGKLGNPVHSAYLQGLLLTGARREELAGVQWQDVDFQWNSLTIRDKVEGQRVIPLTPYVAHLLASLPRRNEWVFSSPTAASGRLQEPRISHNKALNVAGLPDLSLHGLRRSFGTLAEWCEVPTGVVAQIMGHKPSAIAEKHYRRRPLDLLRMWHIKIEAWILEQAGIEFVPVQATLRAVS